MPGFIGGAIAIPEVISLKKRLTLLLVMTLMLSLSGCSLLFQMVFGEDVGEDLVTLFSEPEQLAANPDLGGERYDADTSWVMYWYLCGSDLETEHGTASDDLDEMLAVTLPDHVSVVIQTGGALAWQNDFVNPEKSQRFVYDKDGLRLVEEAEASNMGDAETLADFLAFAKTHYPADRTIVNLWNHGGGTVGGIAYDERHDFDSLDLDELYTALDAVYEADAATPPLDIVGFDACLMASVDVADTLTGFGHYMVASEEVVPGLGWYYTGFLSALAADPGMSTLQAAALICDTYMQGCTQWFSEGEATMSAVNLTEVPALVTAVDAYGTELFAAVLNDPGVYTQFAKEAERIENYGGNTREQGFANMADLGHMARETSALMPERAASVLTALADCVEYEVHGAYREEASGLSFYYSYNEDLDDFSEYADYAASPGFSYLYEYALMGDLSEEAVNYVSQQHDIADAVAALTEIPSLRDVSWDDHPLYVDEDGNAVLDLGPPAYDILSEVLFHLYFVDEDHDLQLAFGTDDQMTFDWENGRFTEHFFGYWGALDGVLCYMELSYASMEYNTYSVPVYINGDRYNLSVIYDYTLGEWEIEGARKPMDELGVIDKELYQLQPGDEIELIYYATDLNDPDGVYEEVPLYTITVDEDTAFDYIEMGEGLFFLRFEMRDSQGGSATSSPAWYEIGENDITTSVD